MALHIGVVKTDAGPVELLSVLGIELLLSVPQHCHHPHEVGSCVLTVLVQQQLSPCARPPTHRLHLRNHILTKKSPCPRKQHTDQTRILLIVTVC